MNREWHQQHKMAEAAGPQQRIEWHLEHVKHCACRPFPQGLLKEISPAQKLKLAQASAEPANHPLR
jgi:hypothetical protein